MHELTYYLMYKCDVRLIYALVKIFSRISHKLILRSDRKNTEEFENINDLCGKYFSDYR